MTNVTILNRYIINPAEPTWTGTFPLSELDQTGEIIHVPTIYLYKAPDPTQFDSNTILQTLKDSLSRVLVHFYPLSGRLRRLPGSRLELICDSDSGGGVELIEAESTTLLVDYLDDDFQGHGPPDSIQHLIPSLDYKNVPVDKLPVLVVQLTRFRCGGISLSMNISHAVLDGQSALHFIAEWARVARGEPVIESAPWLDRTVLRAGEGPRGTVGGDGGEEKLKRFFVEMEQSPSRSPLLLGCVDDSVERKKPTVVAMLPLSKEQVEKLKLRANEFLLLSSSNDDGCTRDSNSSLVGDDRRRRRGYSRYEVVTAQIWRCASKARGHKPDQPTSVGVHVDARRRTSPPLPQKYFGNAILVTVAATNSGDLVTNPPAFACGKIREAVEKIDDNYVWSSIEFLKSQEDLAAYQSLQKEELGRGEEGPFYGNPNLRVISWLTLPIYGMDFGWGKEVYMGPGTTYFLDGDSLVLPGRDGDGSVVVSVCLQVEHMDRFKNYFYRDIDA